MKKALALLAMLAATAGGRGQQQKPAIMPLSEVKPGQVAIVRTVFQGSKIEEFQCEVIGILKNSIGPRKDMILVRLKGPRPEFTGVVAGMSGSPVYIDGRLVGALAYRIGTFTKEPIAGVTPIEDMLEVASYDEVAPQRRAASNWDRGQDEGAAPKTDLIEPIATPLVFSGFDRRLIDHFSDLFRRNNFIPIIGGAAIAPGASGTDFEPGAALACVLMRGDMSISATGTLTYREGDRVLGFGHPLFQNGITDIPMAKAEVLLVLSSWLASFKVAQPTEIIGSIKQDRLTAIMGQIGARARMIPVSVQIATARGQARSYNFEIFEEPALTPLLLNIAVANSLLGMDHSSVQTLNLHGQIELGGYPPVAFSELISSDDTDFFFPSALRASSQLARLFSTLYNNPFERPRIKSISLRADQIAERRAAVIEEVRADRGEVKPGQEFSLAVILRPYRGERVTKAIKLKVPETAERGQELRVMVSDAASFEAAEGRPPFTVQATSLDDLIAQLNRQPAPNAIYIRISQSAPGALINQQPLPSLPLSILSVISSSQTAANTRAMTDSAIFTGSESIDYVISGSKIIRLMVK
jgi:hypothetical protein